MNIEQEKTHVETNYIRNIAIILAVINLLEMAEFYRSEGARNHANPILVYGLICLAIHLMLWYGAKNSNNKFLVAWLLFSLIEIMVCIILIGSTVTHLIKKANVSQNVLDNKSTIHHQTEKDLTVQETFYITVAVIESINLIVLIPFWIAVERFLNKKRAIEEIGV